MGLSSPPFTFPEKISFMYSINYLIMVVSFVCSLVSFWFSFLFWYLVLPISLVVCNFKRENDL